MTLSSGEAGIGIVTHSHPLISRGGAEILARRSFEAFRAAGIRTALFAAVPVQLPGAEGFFRQGEDSIEIGEGEHLLRVGPFDAFLNARPSGHVGREILRLAGRHGLGILHFHHFHQIGFETIDLVRRSRPGMLVGLTLHEFMAICFREGQMLTRQRNQLCRRSHPVDCHLCYPAIPSEAFRLRTELAETVLSRLDLLTAPSRFLAERISSHMPRLPPIAFLPNGVEPRPSAPPPPPPSAPARFAFFGQPTPYKGLDVFLKAASLVLERVGPAAHFHIFGATERDCFETLGFSHLAAIAERWPGNVVFRGPYDPSEVSGLMAGVGWVVVPSIWWENAPLVIGEAFGAGRPVICSGIGGMAEAVRHGIDGLHVRVGDPADLADAMGRCLREEGLWERLRQGLARPTSIAAMNAALLSAYDEARRRRPRAGEPAVASRGAIRRVRPGPGG